LQTQNGILVYLVGKKGKSSVYSVFTTKRWQRSTNKPKNGMHNLGDPKIKCIDEIILTRLASESKWMNANQENDSITWSKTFKVPCLVLQF